MMTKPATAAVIAFVLPLVAAKHADVCPEQTIVLPSNTEFRKLCEADQADPLWPCFAHVTGYDDRGLQHVRVTNLDPKGDSKPVLLARNGDLLGESMAAFSFVSKRLVVFTDPSIP